MPTTRPFQLSLRGLILLTLAAGVLLACSIELWRLIVGKHSHRISASYALLKDIEIACDAYEFDWGEYPPDVGPAGQKSSSALKYYLTMSFRKLPTKGEIWATKDTGPYLDLAPHKLVTMPTGSVAIVDAWGNPIQYDNIRDDKSTPNGFTSYGADDIRTDGKPRNSKGYDLFSRGDPAKNEPVANFEETK